MFKYEPISHNSGPLDGDQWKFKFPNDYGASVIRSCFSYGGRSGLFELAVLNKQGKLIYPKALNPAPNFHDVHGWLTVEQVNALLDRIAAMPTTSALPSSGGCKKHG